jgi:hypothetical protein
MTAGVVLFGLAFTLGSWILFVTINRARATRQMRKRVLVLARGLWHEAAEANMQGDQVLVKLHNQLIELAAIAPGIAAGVVRVSSDVSMTKAEREKVMEFIQRNKWVIPYILTAHMELRRIQFYARPWVPRLAYLASVAAVSLLIVPKNEFGALCFFDRPNNSAPQVEEFVKLDTGGSMDQMAGAH